MKGVRGGRLTDFLTASRLGRVGVFSTEETPRRATQIPQRVSEDVGCEIEKCHKVLVFFRLWVVEVEILTCEGAGDPRKVKCGSDKLSLIVSVMSARSPLVVDVQHLFKVGDLPLFIHRVPGNTSTDPIADTPGPD